MALRKASAYSKKKVTPYTRGSKVKSKSYIKTVPNSRIVKFKMGDLKGYAAHKYPVRLDIVSKENIQIRDNSIEAVRQFLNRFLQAKLGKEWFFEVKVFPHHIIRENKMLTGAGADRMQTGMSRAFGKTSGRSAVVKKNQTLFTVAVRRNQKHEQVARQLIKSVKSRLPGSISVIQAGK